MPRRGGAGSWVAARSTRSVAERARRDGVARRAVAGVEPPLEADLDEDPGRVGLGDHVVERREVERDRLLAERGQAGRGGERQQRARAPAWGRDHERVDPGIDERLRSRCGPDVQFSRKSRGAPGVQIGDGERLDGVERQERPSVERADPADTDHAHPQPGSCVHGPARLSARVLLLASVGG